MASGLFDAYEQELKNAAADISHKTSEAGTYSTSPEESTRLLREVDTLLSQATDLVKQMEIEVRGSDAGTRRLLDARLATYKDTMVALKRDHTAARERSDRASLMAGGSGPAKLLEDDDEAGA